MEEHDIRKRKQTRRRLVRILILEAVIVLSILGFLYIRSVTFNTDLYSNEQKVVEQTVETNINQYLFVLDTLETYYHTYSDENMSADTFEYFLSEEEMTRLGIELVVISPDNTSELVYPVEDNEELLSKDVTEIYEPYIMGMYYQSENSEDILLTKKLEQHNGHDVIVMLSPIEVDGVNTGIVGIYVNYYQFKESNIGVFEGKTLEVSLFDTNGNTIVGDFSKNQATYDYDKLDINRVEIYMGNIISPAHESSSRLQLISQFLIISVIGIAALSLTIWSYLSNQNFIAKLRDIAFVDQVTKLPNDKQLEEDVAYLMAKKRTFHIGYGVFDNIKYLVDRFEQSMGDQAQNYVTEKILQICNNTMRLYKYNEDTFILLRVANKSDDLEKAIKKILKVLDQPIQLNKSTYKLSMYFTVVSYPDDDSTFMNLLKKANSLAQELAQDHTESFAVYSEKHDKDKLTSFDLDNIVKNAEMSSFDVHLQPFVSCIDGSVVGFELLSRPSFATRTVGIQEIVQAMERTGRIMELDYHVIDKGCEYLGIMTKTHPDMWVSINLSPYNLNRKLKDYLVKKVFEYDIKPKNIVLELLESKDIFDNKQAMTTIDKLIELGFKFSIDDFGTGYSSLNSISMIDLSYLKIDKKYVQSSSSDTFDQEILRTLIGLAEKLDFTVIAEGVETDEQLENVKNMGYTIYQGWYFSKAVEFKKACKMLDPEVIVKK